MTSAIDVNNLLARLENSTNNCEAFANTGRDFYGHTLDGDQRNALRATAQLHAEAAAALRLLLPETRGVTSRNESEGRKRR